MLLIVIQSNLTSDVIPNEVNWPETYSCDTKSWNTY